MSDTDAWSNAQAHAQALLTKVRFSNARTYARNLEPTYFVFLTYVGNARRGGCNA
jgi:hypothetical protein